MQIESSKTPRGFTIIKFSDRYGIKCSVQESSLATEAAIWFGVESANPEIMAKDASKYGIDPGDGTGFVPFPVPPEVSFSTRMHLTQEQVAQLLPILQKFAETGEI
jgi:hypothetical protein